MDESLLSKHDSGTSSSSATTTHRTTTSSFRRRSDAIAYGSPYQKAAALVDLAEDGVGLPEQILNGSNFQSAAKFYFFYVWLDFIWTLSFFALLTLNFLEKPLWCDKYAADDCHDREYYFLGQLPYLSGIDSFVYEGITIIILAVHTFFPVTYEGRIYWKNSSNRLKVFFLLVLVADLFIYGLYLSPAPYLPFRIAPYIRVVFFILNVRELRQTTIILAGMLRTYVNILALGLLFLLFSSWLAYVIFEDTHAGQEIFPSYGTMLYKMLILFTTSNNPDVWITAYKASRWYCLFFILYMLLGVYFVTNLILAVVYDSFKGQLAKQVAEMDSMRKRNLAKAYSLIDKNKRGYLDKEQCIRLFEELTKYRTLPKISREEFELIFDELDDSHDFKINLDEFTDICNAISVQFQKEDTPSWLENCPNLYHSCLSEKLKTFVRDPKFGYLIAFILLLNLVAVVIETTEAVIVQQNFAIKAVASIFSVLIDNMNPLDIENSTAQAVWQGVEFVFGWIYVIEMALKVYSFGFENYWKDGQNRFDFIITWIIVIGETATFVSPNGLTFLSNGEWIRYLLLARMLRLIRLLMHVRQYRAFVATFLTLVSSLMPYLGIIFCTMCVYCSLGVQIFGGIVNAGNPELERTVLADDDYYLFNFNDYPNGMVTLFNMLVMNNWQDWKQGYKELTRSSWTIVYFVSFYLITVLLLLNLVVAFVLEAFFAEMELKNSEKGEVQEEETEGKDRHRRYAGSKSRSQRVDVLLHHMLSSELSEAQSTDS